ncbi:MAG: metal-dependent hydrolase [Candidatus Cloacimonetes bacterium]|nr:metal-dependent hydrolase [Candidatus Cloacimonadota bacterium]
MHIQTHFLLSWLVADQGESVSKRDLLIVTLCGVGPDLDGLGLLMDVKTYHLWHHTVGHSIFTGLLIFICIAFLMKNIRLATYASLSFYLHLICDFLGSAGSDGYIWPIYLLWPFSLEKFLNPYQWPLASPINLIVTSVAMLYVMHRASVKGYSPIILFSKWLDFELVKVFKKWFRKT